MSSDHSSVRRRSWHGAEHSADRATVVDLASRRSPSTATSADPGPPSAQDEPSDVDAPADVVSPDWYEDLLAAGRAEPVPTPWSRRVVAELRARRLGPSDAVRTAAAWVRGAAGRARRWSPSGTTPVVALVVVALVVVGLVASLAWSAGGTGSEDAAGTDAGPQRSSAAGPGGASSGSDEPPAADDAADPGPEDRGAADPDQSVVAAAPSSPDPAEPSRGLTTDPAPAADAPVVDWVGVVESVEGQDGDREAADRAAVLTALGMPADVVSSSEVVGVTPGSTLVVTGPFDSAAEARDSCRDGAAVSSCEARRLDG